MANQYGIEDEITRVIGAMSTMDPATEKYTTAAKNLQVLSNVKVDEGEMAAKSLEALSKVIVAEKPTNRVSPDTVVIAVTNIIGILLILNYEQLGVVSSKALGFVLKR